MATLFVALETEMLLCHSGRVEKNLEGKSCLGYKKLSPNIIGLSKAQKAKDLTQHDIQEDSPVHQDGSGALRLDLRG